MNSKILMSGAAAMSLIASAALAQMAPAATAPDTKPMKAHHHHMMAHHKAMERMGEYAPPAQPIPYADLAKYKGDEAMPDHKPMMHKHMMHKHMSKKTDATAPKS